MAVVVTSFMLCESLTTACVIGLGCGPGDAGNRRPGRCWWRSERASPGLVDSP
ncbi:hypothetical protein TOK_1597 [Pseudonocardia sp. N23]|nr:hypothetical protein TOK_1597 [Pseudonocardia sp. N23]